VKRYIYAFDSADAARSAVTLLQRQGVGDQCISLIARTDIELEEIPERFLDASTDFAPALGRGAALGGITGLFAGIVATAIPPLGIAMGGPALIAFFAGGALLGTWASALVGSGVPDEVRRKFEEEIEAGNVLVVIDSKPATDRVIESTMLLESDRHLIWQSDMKTPAAV
jgi:hypothetical protein